MTLEAAEKPREVAKIHLLVHPGFIANELHRETLAGRPVPAYLPDYAQESEKLLARIVEHAGTIPENEIMVVITDGDRSELGSEMPYADLIDQLRTALKRRLIVLTDPTFDSLNVGTSEHVFADFQKLATARGYSFGPQTPLEAYGETSTNCVPRVLAAFKARGHFTGEASINKPPTNESSAVA
mgnify:CR=1 FL=1